ncbi:MAG: hypothetical protein ACRBFS_20650 [Aureispira sp.]
MNFFLLCSSIFLIINVLTTSSCNEQKGGEDSPYQIILDSFVVTQYPPKDPDGNHWSSYRKEFATIHLRFVGDQVPFYEHTVFKHNADPSQKHTLDTQGWIVGKGKKDQHWYDVLFFHKYFGGDELMSQIEQIHLPRNGTPVSVTSLDKEYAVTIHYRHQ